MVKRLLTLLHREFNGLHEAALLLGFSALASQILALIRDRLLAVKFGADQSLDIYYAAFRIPDFLYATIASLVAAAVLIPWLVKYLSAHDRTQAQGLLDGVATLFAVFIIVTAGAAFILMPVLVKLIAPGFSPVAYDQLITLARIMLLSPLFLGLSNLFGAVTQSVRRFFLYALSPLFYNLGIIFGVAVLYPRWGLNGLAWGVVIGALFHWLIQVPSVIADGLLPRPRRHVNWPQLKTVLLTSLPRTATLALGQITTMVLLALASLMPVGSIAVFIFGFNLQSVPLTIIGVSYSVAAFPTLANLFATGAREKFLYQLTLAIRYILFWSVPATVLFIVLRAQIVRVVLGAGSFDWTDTRLTAAALALFVISLVGQSLNLLFVRSYYATGQTTKPLVINFVSALITIGLAVFFWWLFVTVPWWSAWLAMLLRVEDLPGTMLLILPLAFSLGTIINLGLFWFMTERDFGRFPKVVDQALGQSVVASAMSGLVAYQSLNWLDNFLDLDTFMGIATQGVVAGLLGVLVLVVVLMRFQNRELLELKHSLHRKFWRAETVAPEPEGL